MRTYASVEELIAGNPGKALAVANKIVQGGEGTHWLQMPDGTMAFYWSKWIDGRIVPQNWKPDEETMDAKTRMMGWLRAKGAEMVALYSDLAADSTATEAELMAAEDSMRAPGIKSAGAPPVENAPAPKVAASELLAGARFIGQSATTPGVRVDPIVPSGTPGTVTLPVTGHVLSEARPDLGEMFIGYCQRVSDQATGGKADQYIATVAMLFLGTGAVFPNGEFDPNPAVWPAAADKFFNMKAYMTPEERARDAANKQAWDAAAERMKEARKPQPATGGGDPNVDP